MVVGALANKGEMLGRNPPLQDISSRMAVLETAHSSSPTAISALTSTKVGPDEPLFDPPLQPDTLVLLYTFPVQSPFSDNPSVHYFYQIPVISIKLQTETTWMEPLDYSLQLVDLSVSAYPATVIKGLKRRYGDIWIRTKAGNREIDLGEAIRDYKSVARHTIRLVLLARGRNRRLLETLLRFGERNWHNQILVKFDLERFLQFIKTTNPDQPKRRLKANTGKRKEVEKQGFPALSTMKTVTPRQLQSFTPSPRFKVEVSLPYLSPIRCKEPPLTRSLLLHSNDETEYRAKSYERGRHRSPLLAEVQAAQSTLRMKEMLIKGGSPVFSKVCKE
jgi:hypothetical protein